MYAKYFELTSLGEIVWVVHPISAQCEDPGSRDMIRQ